jgi:hypothetical protein
MIEGVGVSAGPSGANREANVAPVARGSWLRPQVAIAVVVLLMTVASTAVVVVNEGGTTHSADTPQAAVQGWAAAVSRGDAAAADSYMSSADLAQGNSNELATEGSKVQVAIQSVSIDGDTARVGLILTVSYPGLAPNQSPGQSMTFNMIREGGRWKIDNITIGI